MRDFLFKLACDLPNCNFTNRNKSNGDKDSKKSELYVLSPTSRPYKKI